MQCDAARFDIMHAACRKAKAQHPVGARASQLDRVGLPTIVRLSRKLYEIDQRNKSETVPHENLRFFAGARP